MTINEFKKHLNDKKIQRKTQGSEIVIMGEGDNLSDLETLPENVTFKNNGRVDLRSFVRDESGEHVWEKVK